MLASYFTEIENHQSRLENLLQTEAEIALSVESALCTASSIIKVAHDYPQSLVAAAELKNNSIARSSSMPLRSAYWLCIIGMRLRFNDHYLQHVLAASLITHSITRLDSSVVLLKRCHAFCREKHLLIWLDILRVHKVFTLPQVKIPLHLAAMSYTQSTIFVALSLALTATTPLVDRLIKIIRKLPWNKRKLVAPLFEYPGNIYSGISYRDATTQDDVQIICQIDNTHVAVFGEEKGLETRKIPVQQVFNTSSYDLSAWCQLYSKLELPLQAHKSVMPNSFPISRPPSSLTRIIDLLDNADADFSDLTELVKTEPLFASYLTAVASQDNRLQLPVSDVKQAVLTYGIDRVGDMLLYRALTQRLQQKHFPLLDTCTRLCELAAAISATITERVNTKISPQAITLMSAFMTAPLYSLPALKTLNKWPATGNRLYRLDSVSLTKASSLHQQAFNLAAQWRLPKRHLVGIRNSFASATDKPTKDSAALILGLGFLLAQHWLFRPTLDDASTSYLNMACKQLKLSSHYIKQIREQLSPMVWRHIPDH